MYMIKYGRGICYSGYREGQSPITEKYPSYDQIKEDLLILEKDFDYLRMYDPSQHAKTTLEVIRKEKLPFKVLLGIDILGEVSNPDCAWGALLSDEQIKVNIEKNEDQLEELIKLANEYEDIIFAVSAGNEAVPEWNENLVYPDRVLEFVLELKEKVKQAVTYCENNNYWISHLQKVAKELDFISVHTYPAWIQMPAENGLNQSIKDYNAINDFYKDKLCIITEAGWPTVSSGRGIPRDNASEESQIKYIEDMQKWSKENEVLIFFFEAFDEPWKGSNKTSDQDEPEKHWGFYYESRKPKKLMK